MKILNQPIKLWLSTLNLRVVKKQLDTLVVFLLKAQTDGTRFRLLRRKLNYSTHEMKYLFLIEVDN